MKLAILVLCSICALGCKDFNKIHNPVAPGYPCGTRAHACSLTPLTCCWNGEVCGGQPGSGCPDGMCCFVGDRMSTPQSETDAGTPETKNFQQWSPEK
jgi:hypothetical protein